MLQRVVLALMACVLFAATGCDTVKPYWKSTKKLYKEYVNTDPSIDLSQTGDVSDTERKLASLFTPVDEQLEYLLRTLSAQDLPPEREWCQQVVDAFPWLTGVAVLDAGGSPLFKMPSFSLKPVDFAPLQDFEALYKARKMAAFVAASELGTDIMIAKPLYVDNDLKGLLVAYFDAASLARVTPEADQLYMAAPGVALWNGDDPGAAQALAQMDWKNILRSRVSGDQMLGGKRYLWQARAVAQIRLIYAVAHVPDKPKAKPAPKPAPQPEPVPGSELPLDPAQPAPAQPGQAQ